MTAQSSNKLGSLASSVRGAARTSYRASIDLLCVAVVFLVVAAVTVPIVHHIYSYWHSIVAAPAFWQSFPAAQQKAAPTIKRAQP